MRDPWCVYCLETWTTRMSVCQLTGGKEGIWVLDITVPILPPCNTSSHMGFRQQTSENQAVRNAVWVALLQAKAVPKSPLQIVDALFVRRSSRRPDPTNLAQSFKAVEDELIGVTHAVTKGSSVKRPKRVLEDDSAEHYLNGSPTYEWEKAPVGEGSIRIRIIEVKR
jgi:hypothetical protein